MFRILLLLLALGLLPTLPARAATVIACQGADGADYPASPGKPCPVTVPASAHLVSTVLTKIAGGGTYTSATSSAPEAICLFASVTVCAPVTMTVSSNATVTGSLTSLQLVKSTTGATAATFRVYVYKAAPTMTGVFDTSTYLPLRADLLSGSFLGIYECATQIVNGDNGLYNCSRAAGNIAFNLTDGTLRFVVLATAAYVSGSSETFFVSADILMNSP